MKLIIIIMTTFLMQVSAAGFAQKVTFVQRNVSIEQVFDQINKQTGYNVVWSSRKLDPDKKINANFKDAGIDEVLKMCLADKSLTYDVKDKSIVIKERETFLLDDVKEKITGLFQQQIYVVVYLKDSKGMPLAGGSATLLGAKQTVRANEQGIIAFNISKDEKVRFSYVGYVSKEILITAISDKTTAGRKTLNVVLDYNPVELQNVNIVSTGYQDIPKERATGSFEVVDNKTLNLVTGVSLLKRLEGNVTGFDFNNPMYQTSSSNPNLQQGVLANLTIRGSNTLYGSSTSGSRVLVVIDGVVQIDNGSKYTEDQIGKLNYNDVESMTMLRDAAAVSVYGSRAANGVIVITTKKGKFDTPMQISVNENVTVTEKPDLYYLKRANTSDYVDIQKFLYSKGQYNAALNTPNSSYFISHPAFTPTTVAEILDQQKKGILTVDQANAKLANLGNNDVRRDLNKYFQRNSAVYSNNISINGGANKVNYYMSVGYDKTLNNTVTSNKDNLSINSNVGIKLLKNLDLQTSITYTQTNKNNQSTSDFFSENALGTNTVMPYDKLADDQGNPLAIVKLGGLGKGFRQGYIDTVGGGRLLDMNFKPLQNIYDSYNRSKAKDIIINLTADYKFNDMLSAKVVYGYTNSGTNIVDYYSVNSYFTRYTINYFTSFWDAGTPYQRNIPLGGFYNPTVDNLTGNTLRGQLNLNKTWHNVHNITAVAGIDFFSSNSLTRNDLYLGYRDDRLTYYNAIDYNGYLPVFRPGGTQQILQFLNNAFPSRSITDNNQRMIKEYINAAYSFKNLYTISGSIAKDASNVFGADFNKSFKPYYSGGLLWNINNESFYKLSWLPKLGLRATFGYNGNVNYTYSPKAYIVYYNDIDPLTGFTLADLQGASNPNLRPEKTGQLNLALDFGLKGGRINGTIEWYQKWNKDLIGAYPLDPTLGPGSINFNTADKVVKGIDVNISSTNIKTTNFTWGSNLLISHKTDKITKVYTVVSANGSLDIVGAYSSGTGLPNTTAKVKDYGVDALFAYTWAGLNHDNGAPQGYINGVVSSDINALRTSGDYRYIGGTLPVYFGSFRNTFTYKNFSITANLLYKLGYYRLRSRSSLFLQGGLAQGTSLVAAEYAQRWQNPGDEAFTNVPALNYPINSLADQFYQSADINAYKADHIRLQSISCSYRFSKAGILKNLSVYGNIQNLGIIWRANKFGLDPDINDLPQPRTYAIGLNKTF